MNWRKELFRAFIAPLAIEVAAKVGEAVGDLLAWKINPPEEEKPDNTSEGPLSES